MPEPSEVNFKYGKLNLTEKWAFRGVNCVFTGMSDISRSNIDKLEDILGVSWIDGLAYWRKKCYERSARRGFILIGKDNKDNLYAYWRKETDNPQAGQTILYNPINKKNIKVSCALKMKKKNINKALLI